MTLGMGIKVSELCKVVPPLAESSAPLLFSNKSVCTFPGALLFSAYKQTYIKVGVSKQGMVIPLSGKQFCFI